MEWQCANRGKIAAKHHHISIRVWWWWWWWWCVAWAHPTTHPPTLTSLHCCALFPPQRLGNNAALTLILWFFLSLVERGRRYQTVISLQREREKKDCPLYGTRLHRGWHKHSTRSSIIGKESRLAGREIHDFYILKTFWLPPGRNHCAHFCMD